MALARTKLTGRVIPPGSLTSGAPGSLVCKLITSAGPFAVAGTNLVVDQTILTVGTDGAIAPGDGLISIPQEGVTEGARYVIEWRPEAYRPSNGDGVHRITVAELTGTEVAITSLVDLDAAPASGSVAEALMGYRDHGSVSGSLTLAQNIATQVVRPTGPLTLTAPDARNGASITVDIPEGQQHVSWSGVAWPEGAPDGVESTVVILLRTRDMWVGWSTRAPIPDDTPPSAPSQVRVSRVGSHDAEIEFVPGVDPETSVGYQTRVGEGSWVTRVAEGGTIKRVTLTGLTADTAYSAVQIRSTSRGGESEPVAVPEFRTDVLREWSTIASDDFTGPDGPLAGRTVGGAAWAVFEDRAVRITTNRATFQVHGTNGYARLPVTTASKTLRVSADYSGLVTGNQAAGVSLSRTAGGNQYYESICAAVNGDGILRLMGYQVPTTEVTGVAKSGRITLTIATDQATVEVNGTTLIGPVTLPFPINGAHAGLFFQGDASAPAVADNWLTEAWQ